MTPHDATCPDPHGTDCRCAPTVRCPAVIIDLDSYARRCLDGPHDGPGHDAGDWAWTDATAGVAYTRPGE